MGLPLMREGPGMACLLAQACIRFGRAGSASDFGTDQSRSVYLVPLIASASLILIPILILIMLMAAQQSKWNYPS